MFFPAVKRSEKEIEKLSEYERQRLKNIAEIELQLADPLDIIQQSANQLKKSNISAKQRAKSKKSKLNSETGEKTSNRVNFVRRSSRIIQEKRQSTNYNEQSDDENDKNDTKKLKNGSLKIKFRWFKSSEYKKSDEMYYNSLDDSDFIHDGDEEYESDYESSAPGSKRKRKVYTPRLAVSQVTQEMIENISYSSSGKVYSQSGTTCHQCRQKTADQKSYCRYKGCSGVRGNFCGFCLGRRYGENVASVLVNPKWACPPCRGYCNCSICRRRKGMAPTGQLAQQAVAGGYESVRHMLSSIEGEGPDVADFEFDDEDNNQNEAENNRNEADKNNDTKVCYSNEENNLEIQDDNDNVSDEVKCIDSNEQCNSDNHEDECVTEIKETHEMIIDKLYKQLLSED
ncbi:cell division cycle-associated protein 7 [Acyrthosiphon pisum]|uniref:Zinc-finger domain-containing protein n=1 Tax=Acyrthosiphon pisum TaxID=7029 RepID=A0A8R1VZ58_ACYPI|nr:cell division cycle-associated protein 7 [Acyrthosiphon pisum]|eukprot:XP_001944678.1 PREDICTED: cell division cycle-associated protein 7 [Acyrthosiphon pisum]